MSKRVGAPDGTEPTHTQEAAMRVYTDRTAGAPITVNVTTEPTTGDAFADAAARLSRAALIEQAAAFIEDRAAERAYEKARDAVQALSGDASEFDAAARALRTATDRLSGTAFRAGLAAEYCASTAETYSDALALIPAPQPAPVPVPGTHKATAFRDIACLYWFDVAADRDAVRVTRVWSQMLELPRCREASCECTPTAVRAHLTTSARRARITGDAYIQHCYATAIFPTP
jgi:hypothetical protein